MGGIEYYLKYNKSSTHPHHSVCTDGSGLLGADVQLPLRDVYSFSSWVTAGYHGSQWGQLDRRVEEAVLGDGPPLGGGHQRLLQKETTHNDQTDDQRNCGNIGWTTLTTDKLTEDLM